MAMLMIKMEGAENGAQQQILNGILLVEPVFALVVGLVMEKEDALANVKLTHLGTVH